jgi:hypothetical protein
MSNGQALGAWVSKRIIICNVNVCDGLHVNNVVDGLLRCFGERQRRQTPQKTTMTLRAYF